MEESNADIAVSIHLNAHPDRSISGPMVYYTRGIEKIKTAVHVGTERVERGIREREDHPSR